MLTVHGIDTLRGHISRWREVNMRIALVPTMGNLHEGHLQLVREACAIADRVVVSVFVNPLQFGPDEDYADYPRTLEKDSQLLINEGVDLLFSPDVEEMYPHGRSLATKVEVPELSDILCGAFRPGHFAGVTTVVSKLFNIVQPHVALFGEKDYQQMVVIRRMVEDLSMPIEIRGVSTLREPDGLAMSSRNQYLDSDERKIAPVLYKTLVEAGQTLDSGEINYADIEQVATEKLRSAGFRPDYVAVRDAVTLGSPFDKNRELVILAAAWLGRARLIDNLRIGGQTAT